MKTALATLLLCSTFLGRAAQLAPVVEIEEDVYSFTNANNGAGPMWCSGSTSLVRSGDHVFASGLETVADAKPLNNCRWALFHRGPKGWERVREDGGRTREPSPLVAFKDGRVFLSANPTLGSGPRSSNSPRRNRRPRRSPCYPSGRASRSSPNIPIVASLRMARAKN